MNLLNSVTRRLTLNVTSTLLLTSSRVLCIDTPSELQSTLTSSELKPTCNVSMLFVHVKSLLLYIEI